MNAADNRGDGAVGIPDLATCEPGTVLLTEHQALRREDLVAYADASGDQNPIHQDEDFARSIGLPDVIAHGMLTMGLVASAVERVAAGRLIRTLGARFASTVVVPADPGEAPDVEMVLTLVARDDVVRTATLDAAVSVAGTKVVTRTRAVIQLD